MRNKIIVLSSVMMAASLWFVYVLGFHNGVKEAVAQAQVNQEGMAQPRVSGHYFGGINGARSKNYQAEPFPPPKPMKLPPLAPTPTHAVEYE